MEIIREQKEINYETLILRGDKYDDRGYIFSDIGGQPMREGKLNTHLREEATPLMNFPNKKLTTHIFRHTHVSILAELGVPLKAIMARVGHSSPKTTLGIYTHVTEGMQAKVIEKLNSYTSAPFSPLSERKSEEKNWINNVK